jgi:hypothetical protein
MTSGVLVAFGFSWMMVAALLGLHLGARHANHIDTLSRLAQGGDLAAFYQTFEAFQWRTSVHAHGMLFSLSAITVGLALPLAGYGQTMSAVLVGTLIVATVIWTLSACMRIRLLMGLGDLAFVCIVATVAWGAATHL